MEGQGALGVMMEARPIPDGRGGRTSWRWDAAILWLLEGISHVFYGDCVGWFRRDGVIRFRSGVGLQAMFEYGW